MAHLPGVVAAMTALPVIGIPVKGSSLDGVDSLHSIVQMLVCILRYLALVGLLISSHILAAWDSGGDGGYQNEEGSSTKGGKDGAGRFGELPSSQTHLKCIVQTVRSLMKKARSPTRSCG